MRRLQKWIRRRVRAWLGVEAELAELRGRLHRLEKSLPPQPEKWVKVHHAG